MDGVFSDFSDLGVAALTAFPEPQMYALMLAGLGVVLRLSRYRRESTL